MELNVNEIEAVLKRIGADVDKFIAAQKSRTGELTDKNAELQARLLDVEQKLARNTGGGDPTPGYGNHALRTLLEASAELKAVAERKARRAVIEMPAGYFNVQAAILSTGIAMPDQRPEIVAPPQRRFTVRSLIPSGPTTHGAITYLEETAFTNAAAPVSESEQKPESTFTYALRTSAVVTIAHFVKVALQALSDIPQMAMHIDSRLRYGVALAEENQLLKGSGVGNNLRGLMTAATAYSGGTGTMMDVLRKAAGQLEDTDYQPSGFVLHPADWRQIQMVKDSQGRYVLGDPGGTNPARLWGLPVVPTAAMTAENFLVLDGPQAALIFDREESRVDISTEDDDNFQKNLATVRGEERIALAILRTGALVKGTFGS